MALVTQTQTNWGAHSPDIASGVLFGAPLLPNTPSWPEADLATGWVIKPGDTMALDASGLSVEGASLQLNPPACAGEPATLTVTLNTAFAAPYTPGSASPEFAIGVGDGAGNWIVPPSPSPPSASPTVLVLPLTAAEAAAGYWVTVLFTIQPLPNPATFDFTTSDANGITVTAVAELTYDDAACAPVAVGCVGEATHLDDCGVTQWSELLQQTVDALRPEVRWSSICDDGVPGVTAWQKWSSVDNGLTWTLLGTFTEQFGATAYVPVGALVDCVDAPPMPIYRWSRVCDDGAVGVTAWQKWASTDNGLTWTLVGTFTEQYGTTPYVPVGALVDCCGLGAVATGKRARRAVLGAATSTPVPTGLPTIGAAVESLSWASRNATGTITDSVGTVSTFVAGEGDTWDLDAWLTGDDITVDVTTGEVVIAWIEVY